MAGNDLIKNTRPNSNRLIITAQAEALEQVQLGVHIIRDDLKSTQEEADCIIPYQVSEAIADEKNSVKIICEDTDVFILLPHCYDLKNWEMDLYMAGFMEGKNIISIKDAVKKHKVLIPGLLSVHATSGCDTVPMYYGTGKKEAINITGKLKLSFLGQVEATFNKASICFQKPIQKMICTGYLKSAS